MHILLPPWLAHGRREDGARRPGGAPARAPIFSADIQPLGERLATAGQDSAVCVWSLPALARLAVQQPAAAGGGSGGGGVFGGDTAPDGAHLAKVTGHSAAVNCVRWSPRGDLFASGGDDAVVLICEKGEGGGRSAAFGGGGEDWRVRKPLRGHTADVTDVCWSPDGERIASASVDNTIGVWSVRGESLVVMLRGHTGLVKGICWDPVGRFLASQSDDRSCMVWRTSDWGMETKMTESFANAVFTANANVYFQRCSWSPCGTQLLTTNGVKLPNADVAPMFTRQTGFRESVDLVGHPKPVVSTRFSPRLYRKEKSGAANGGGSVQKGEKGQPYTCLALGSKDGTISVWQALAKRPFVCLKDVFHHDCIDLSWGSDGYQLVACSSDGEVIYVRFSPEELGTVVPYDEERQLLADMWRKFGGAGDGDALVETPVQLAMENSHRVPPHASNGSSKGAQMPRNGEAMPVLAPAPAPASAYTPAAVPAPPAPVSVGAPGQAPGSAVDRQPVGLVSRAPTSAMAVAPTPPATAGLLASQREGRARSGKRRIIPAAVSTSGHASERGSLLNSNSIPAPADVPMYVPTESVPAGPDAPSALKRPRAGAVTNGFPAAGAAAAAAATAAIQPVAQVREAIGVALPPPPLYKPSVVGLSMTLLPNDAAAGGGASRCRAIDSQYPPTMLEAREQHGSSRGGGFMVSCTRGGSVQWRDYYPLSSPIALLAGVAEKFAAVGTTDGMLTLYSAASGRRLTPSIALDSAPHLLEAYVFPLDPSREGTGTGCTDEHWYVLVVTRSGLCSVFDVRHKKLVCARSAAPLLSRPVGAKGSAAESDDTTNRAEVYRSISKGRVTSQGEPLLILSDSHAFSYSRDWCSWLRIADDSVPNSEFNRGVASSATRVGIVRSLQASAASSGRAPTLSGMGDLRRAAVETLAHLETLLESSVALSSPEDYRYYLTNYASKLATAADDDVENSDRRLRELCDSLLRVGAKSREDCLVLGMDCRSLLRDVVLSVVSSKTSMQRLVSEYMASLTELDSRTALDKMS